MNFDSKAFGTGYVVLNVYIRLTPGDGNIYTTTRYMELRSTMDYAVHVTTRYIQLHSTWYYTVYTTTQYMGLRSTWDYAVHGTTQYSRLYGTGDYTVQVRKVHGTMPHLGLRSTMYFDLAWTSYPGQVDNDSTLKLVLKVIFVFICLSWFRQSSKKTR